MSYVPTVNRYEQMKYNRCGQSGLKLPAVSLGLWQNFGDVDQLSNQRAMLRHAFDNGITHFDLANNYGPPAGSAEINFGRIMREDFSAYRDELLISTKAGYLMHPGPYGDWSSRKYLLSSLDASLKRMGLDYVDIFYSHRFDPETPLEETMSALADAVHQGKALYVGISSYSPTKTREAYVILKEMGVRCLIHQPSYSMLNRWVEDGLLGTLTDLGMGCIAFSPLAQGLLTPKYLDGIPENSRAGKQRPSMKEEFLNDEILARVRELNKIAQQRDQSLAQMALAWVLHDPRITSVLIGASSVGQLDDNLSALDNLAFSEDELAEIDKHAKDSGINLWARSSEAG